MDTTGSASPNRAEDTAGPRRRADAERNIAAILDAALVCFGENPQATMTDIARKAGVGRVTLYGHFPSREQLVTAALHRAVGEVHAAFEAISPDEPVDKALRSLIRSSWQVLDRHRTLFDVARRSFDHQRLRQHHDQALRSFDDLIARGRKTGVLRTDLPRDWLVTTTFALFHAAAEEVNAGRMHPTEAADTLQATLLPALTTSR